jgi:RNA polymerase sigma-70 factor (ECF subfamily)
MAGDDELIERIRQGDREAFGELVRRYQRKAYAVAWRLLGHQHDAEDVVQESFMVALDAIDDVDLGRPFGPWLNRIVANRSHNAREKRRVRQVDQLGDEVPAADRAPDANVEHDETARQVRAALDGLSARQRTVIQLHELDGFSTAEIAQSLGITEATVRWTVHAGRKALRSSLAIWKEQRDA